MKIKKVVRIILTVLVKVPLNVIFKNAAVASIVSIALNTVNVEINKD